MTRTGATLIELTVVLAIVAILAGVTAASLGALQRPRELRRAGEIRQARFAAIRQGQPMIVRVRGVSMAFLPDGRVIGGLVDPLSGEPRYASY